MGGVTGVESTAEVLTTSAEGVVVASLALRFLLLFFDAKSKVVATSGSCRGHPIVLNAVQEQVGLPNLDRRAC